MLGRFEATVRAVWTTLDRERVRAVHFIEGNTLMFAVSVCESLAPHIFRNDRRRDFLVCAFHDYSIHSTRPSRITRPGIALNLQTGLYLGQLHRHIVGGKLSR